MPTDEVHRPDEVAGAREHAGRSVSPVEVRDLERPEAVVTFPLGETQQVRLAGTVVSRIVLQPGWNLGQRSLVVCR